jgi:hypothetical protein
MRWATTAPFLVFPTPPHINTLSSHLILYNPTIDTSLIKPQAVICSCLWKHIQWVEEIQLFSWQ